jgi:hypothetical protein
MVKILRHAPRRHASLLIVMDSSFEPANIKPMRLHLFMHQDEPSRRRRALSSRGCVNL